MMRLEVKMKLDFECIRDVLLALEDLCGYDEQDSRLFKRISCQDILKYIEDTSDFKCPSIDEIKYTVLKLSEGGFIKIETISDINPVDYGEFIYFKDTPENYVIDITYQGYELLSTIRDTKFLRNIKTGIDGLPNSSIKAFLKMFLH